MGAGSFRFGEFELDGARQQLLRAGQVVDIQPRPLRLVLYLVEHRERIVPREELFDLLWPETAISDGALSTVVYEARQALGDSQSTQTWIRTARGRGFQFVGEVEAPVDREAPAPAGREPEEHWVRAAAAASVLLLVAGAGAWVFWDRISLSPSAPPTSILVLPFEDLSPDADHAWLASGIAEELTDALIRIPQLDVRSRSAGEVARRRGWSVWEIGRRAGVGKVIEGSVRSTDDQLRITVRLTDAPSGSHDWSKTYDRSMAEVLELQRDIATAVARQLRVQLSARTAPTESVKAWEEYRIGVALQSQGTAPKSLRAREHLEHAIRLDPEFAAPYAALVRLESYLCHLAAEDCELARARAHAAARRALELDPESPLVHRAQAGLLAREWDWEGAEKAERRALELGSPGGASLLLASLLLEKGEVAEGLAMLEQMEGGGLTEAAANYIFGTTHQMMGVDLDRGLELLDRAVELSRGYWEASAQRYSIYRLQGRDPEALKSFLEPSFITSAARRQIEEAFEDRGWPGFDAAVLDLVQRSELGPLTGPCGPAGAATGRIISFYIRAGDPDGALDCLERAYERRDIEIFWHLGTSWVWDPIRDHPRFQKVLRGTGLAEIAADALPRVRAYRDCSGPSPSEIHCTDLKPRSVASR